MSVPAVAAAAALLILTLGACGSEADPTESAEYQAMLEEKDDKINSQVDLRLEAEDQVYALKGEIVDLESELDDVRGRLAKLEKQKVEIAEGRRALAAAQRKVVARERKVGIVEREIAANTIPGDGVYRVGTDMRPGTYRSVNNVDCYWSINRDANGSDIIDNGIVTGPALTTVSAGTFFETTRCGKWVLQQ